MNDLLGIAPYGEAVKEGAKQTGEIAKCITEKSLETAQQLFNDLCQPAAAEVGLLLRDQVRAWRANNLANIASKALKYLTVTADGLQLKAPPRLVAEIIESGSLCDDEGLQTMWAGLLASSLTLEGKDDFNLIFTSILKQLTSIEAKFIEHVCLCSSKALSNDKIVIYGYLVSFTEAQLLLCCEDTSTAEAHLGRLRSLGLIGGPGLGTRAMISEGLYTGQHGPIITPETLALAFYARCKGSRGSLREFYNVIEQHDPSKGYRWLNGIQ